MRSVAQASSAMSDSTDSGSTLRATSPARAACAAADAVAVENVARANTMPAADAPQLRVPTAGGMETETLSRSPASCAESDDVLWSSPAAAEAATAAPTAPGASAALYQRQGTDESLLADNGPSKARARYGSDEWSTASAI